MSAKRNKATDRARTQGILDGRMLDTEAKRNWLGHSRDRATSRLDALLLAGATRAELDQIRGAIDEHIHHLRNEHGLPVPLRGGKWYLL